MVRHHEGEPAIEKEKQRQATSDDPRNFWRPRCPAQPFVCPNTMDAVAVLAVWVAVSVAVSMVAADLRRMGDCFSMIAIIPCAINLTAPTSYKLNNHTSFAKVNHNAQLRKICQSISEALYQEPFVKQDISSAHWIFPLWSGLWRHAVLRGIVSPVWVIVSDGLTQIKPQVSRILSHLQSDCRRVSGQRLCGRYLRNSKIASVVTRVLSISQTPTFCWFISRSPI